MYVFQVKKIKSCDYILQEFHCNIQEGIISCEQCYYLLLKDVSLIPLICNLVYMIDTNCFMDWYNIGFLQNLKS